MSMCKCCKCGRLEDVNFFHCMLDNGKYICIKCANKLRKKLLEGKSNETET